MKKIKDERLILQGLKNIRVAFLVQSVGILAVLVYQLIVDGVESLVGNPLWLVFTLTVAVLSYQNLKIANDMEDKKTNPGPYYWVVLYAAFFGIIMGLLAYFFPGEKNASALLVGGIVFVCFLIPFSIVHHLLKKRLKEEE